MDTKAISRARDMVGGTTALSAALQVAAATVSGWVSGDRPVPAARCPQIERLTKGKVTCEELRPDVDWAYLRASKKKAAA